MPTSRNGATLSTVEMSRPASEPTFHWLKRCSMSGSLSATA